MRDEPQANSFVSQEVEASRLFFLEPELDENFSVVFGGFERCRPDYRMDRQNFPWFTFEFVSHGEGTLRLGDCLLYTSPSPRDRTRSRMPSSA